MTRISSIRKVAEFMSEVIGKKISTRPVTEMMKKFRNGELNITEEEIRKVAESDPLASKWYQFFEQSPKKPGRVPRKNSAE